MMKMTRRSHSITSFSKSRVSFLKRGGNKARVVKNGGKTFFSKRGSGGKRGGHHHN